MPRLGHRAVTKASHTDPSISSASAAFDRRGRHRARAAAGEIHALHAVGEWLAPTKTWLYQQVATLPADRVVSSVVAVRRNPATPAEFADIPVAALSDHAARFFLYRAVRRSGGMPVNGLLRGALRKGGTGVLHSHFGHIGWSNSRLLRGGAPPHVVTFYGYDVSHLPRDELWLSRYQDLFARVDRVLCEGEQMASAIGALGCPPERVRVHHLGVDVRTIDFRPRRRAEGEPPRILMAAAFKPKKGFPDALRALARLRESYPDLRVTVVGDAEESTIGRHEKQAIAAAVSECRLEDAISFLGMRSAADLRELAYQHHIFLSPSRIAPDGDTEGGAPVSIIEMAASGMPIASTTHCDIPGVLGAPNRALLAAEGDVAAVHRELEDLVAMEDWTTLTEENRRHVELEFASDHQSRRLAEIYAEVVEGAG
jgi:colanic acid/amylovoran biosynthesis glycosyltransferase